ncbi:MAG: nuclear transport factor 2 family protein [Bacteroidota bacterium]
MKSVSMFLLLSLLGLSGLFAQAEFYKPQTSVPDNKDEMIAKSEAYLNAGFEGKIEEAATFLHDDFYEFPAGSGQDSLNKETTLKEMKVFSENWSDLSWKGISTCIKDENSGNTVVFLWGRAKGTQNQSGKAVDFMNHQVHMYRDGKIMRIYHYHDNATIGAQLGFKMMPAEAGEEQARN